MNETNNKYTIQIVIAIIGLIGVLGSALFANWDKIFSENQISNEIQTNNPKDAVSNTQAIGNEVVNLENERQEIKQPHSANELPEYDQTMINKKRIYAALKGIPTFDPDIHSDGCGFITSSNYSKLEPLQSKFGSTMPWRECCVKYDQAYYYGGSTKDRKEADKVFNECIEKKVGKEYTALILELMEKPYVEGNTITFPSRQSWGYGEYFVTPGAQP